MQRSTRSEPNKKRNNQRNSETHSAREFSLPCTLRLQSQSTVISSPSLYISERKIWHFRLTLISYSRINPGRSELHWNAKLLCNSWDENLTFARAKLNIYILKRGAPEGEACGGFFSLIWFSFLSQHTLLIIM